MSERGRKDGKRKRQGIVPPRAINRGGLGYTTTLAELEAKIEVVAQRRLGMSRAEVEAICESGEWEKYENHYALWSWLNNLIEVARSMRKRVQSVYTCE